MNYDNTNRGVLFKNQNKEKETHSDYNGTININGKDHYLNAWIKEGKGGKFMGLALSPKEVQEKPSERSKSTGFDDMADDIPF